LTRPHLILFLICLLAPVCARPAAVYSQAPAGSVPAPVPETSNSATLVVLVHGMGRTSLSMLPLELALERSGYRVLNFHYSSYGPSIAQIGTALAHSIDAELRDDPAANVHFVGHSLGNIVLRWLLVHQPPPARLGRFVMLAPPNRGSRVADRLAPYLGWLLAPISELETVSSTAVELPAPPGVEFAIIAGEWDDKVRVVETCLPGASAHAVIPSGHTFILMRSDVIRMIRRFLGEGTFFASDSPVSTPCA
jgi:pimeloyl-ACP methyl ester carboxylesterase